MRSNSCFGVARPFLAGGVWGGMPVARNARYRYGDRARAERLTAPAAGVKGRPCPSLGAWGDGGGLIGFKDFAVSLIGVT